jgi:uncharacterized protein (TIGR02996 family)
LLAEAKERPDEDLPRLLLADWLDDHGEPERAEFIRAQCRRARMENGADGWGGCHHCRQAREKQNAPELEALRRRERELLDRHEADWLGPLLNTPLRDWGFRRGLIRLRPKKAELCSKEFASLEGTEALAWVEGVELHGLSDHSFRRCLTSAVLAEVVDLEVRECGVGPPGMEALAACPFLVALSSLRFEYCRVGPEVEALSASATLRRLTRLALRRTHVGEDDLAPLTALPRLTELDLAGSGWLCGLGGLPDSPLLAQLARLDLNHNDLLHEDPGVYSGRTSIAALAASPNVSRLTHLGLADNFLATPDAEWLLNSPHLGRLVVLDLCANDGFRPEVEEALRRRFPTVTT